MDRLKTILTNPALLEFIQREREKRITLEELPPECKRAKRVRIQQGFIKEVRKDNAPYCDVRVRKVTGKAKDHTEKYTLTAKYRPEFQEATTDITKEMFEALWPKTSSKQLKERYVFENGWIVDHIKNGENRVVAEYEYKEGHTQARIPEGWKVKQDAWMWDGLPGAQRRRI